jgi:metal-responsive CopG/Arc/MetJ family transcriptional regulator
MQTRTHIVAIRLNDHEVRILDALCEKNQTRRSETLRDLLKAAAKDEREQS